MTMARAVERIWFGASVPERAGRAALLPLAAVYRGASALRTRLYDTGVLRVAATPIPAVSVGNLTVGGTGKTPVAAWIASRLSAMARPAVVLRGYGGDEIDVHRALNPAMIVVANADRAAGVAEAARLGADVAVLDDAFQHRRIRRVADIVLVSVEQTLRNRHILPAGPWREPLSAAQRADLVLLTSKTASTADVNTVRDLVRRAASNVPPPLAALRLVPHELVDASAPAMRRPLAELRGQRVVAIAAIGEPELFRQQLAALGADVSLRAYPDHHAFTDDEIAGLARSASTAIAICTLKDAVKLAARWPAASRLWYVSQQLLVEQGAEDLDRLLQRVIDARQPRASTPSAG
ncbi:MAG TPA: tetraacyldisaccharide 4'-kinase [Gemmatimonadaceae bacterium]|nr:tetraacyldisaccharide 4'-kinase [Gemmatimonadaceae bacterium]